MYKVIMALFKYFKKVKHTVLESAQANGLKEVEENEIQKHLQSISEPKPKKKKKDNTMVIMTRFSKQKLPNGVLSIGKCLQPGNLAFPIGQVSTIIKKAKLKMKNSENFQERIVARKPE